MDWIIHRVSENDHFKTAMDIWNELQMREDVSNISVHAIQRCLRGFGLMERIAVKKPWVSECNRKWRLNFARQYQHWGVKEWGECCFWVKRSTIDLGVMGEEM